MVDAATGHGLVFEHEERTNRFLATSLEELFAAIVDASERTLNASRDP